MNIGTAWKPTPNDDLDPPLLAGVELGGTKIIFTLGTGPDAIIESDRISTSEAEPTLIAIEDILDRWLQSHPSIAAIGLASFGPLELDPAAPDYGSITRTTKPGWSNTDIACRIRGRYKLPLAIDTDVNGAALAEGRWGAARGLRSWAYITIGTGVGAGIVVDKSPVRGLGHSEAGHMIVRRAPDDGFAGICPFHGDCIEGLVSGPAIAARAGVKGEHIPDDDPLWASVSATIAGLIHNLAMTTAPERIILGGGVIERRPSLFSPIRQAVVNSLAAYAHTPAIAQNIDTFIVPPALGEMAGPLGALALASDAASARPLAVEPE